MAGETADSLPVHDERLVALTTLLLLEQEARHKKDVSSLAFLMVNETHRLFPYRQCSFWETDAPGHVKIKTVSGLSVIDPDAPYLVWLERLIEKELKQEKGRADDNMAALKTYTPQDFNEETQKDLKEWGVRHAALLSMSTTRAGYKCGLWLDRDTPFQEREQHLLSQIADSYAHALDRLLRQHDNWKRQLLSYLSLSRVHKIFALLVLAVLLFPVRLSVVAPAEIIARDPFIVSSPVQGVIADVNVQPNDTVKEGDPLIRMEDTVLRNQVTLAAKAMEIAQTAYTKASREAFSDPKIKAQLAMLQAEIESKKLEHDYALELLSLLTVPAPRSGIIVFTDSNSLRGLPVQPGERIMSLVDPKDTEVLIRIPAESVILLEPDIPAKLFLNISPLRRLEAEIKTVSYEATPDPDGLLTYKVRAVFPEGVPRPSIGLKGTARLYGGYTLFGYQMLRRPLATLRRTTGL
ncbi:MAG: HlyD family efflux transporter periplasmic adaptor subunit [Rhodospirillales bacterium]|nr:HlyD family efflux transporter periplasmic adaptor subunit [Alphaproteobacteria bacterium]USO04437.1 MAG: HlyD family efflux transporter periplasmic adaptor subunit [Rhodospirillales bacterium]